MTQARAQPMQMKTLMHACSSPPHTPTGLFCCDTFINDGTYGGNVQTKPNNYCCKQLLFFCLVLAYPCCIHRFLWNLQISRMSVGFSYSADKVLFHKRIYDLIKADFKIQCNISLQIHLSNYKFVSRSKCQYHTVKLLAIRHSGRTWCGQTE